uniref:hypothetical protein n=1 Tax=Anaerolentibacter hominis TaxID=3079009 RepID=UPI0031B89312
TMSMGSTVFAKDVTDKSTTEVTKDGTSNDMTLKGTVGEPGASLISVVLPSSINFQIGTTATDGYFDKIISSTGTITNNSTTKVKIELAEVRDDGKLLDLVDLALAPDKLDITAAMDNKLSVGMTAKQLGDNLVPGDKLSLKVYGQAKTATTVVTPGDYNVVTTLKVTAVPDPVEAP